MARKPVIGGVVALVTVALVATGCTSERDRGAVAQATSVAATPLTQLAALDLPVTDDAPRGLLGDPWVVWMPADDPPDPAIGTAGGVQVVLGADPETTYSVYDDLDVSTSQPLWSGPGPATVPAGTLRNGGVYHVVGVKGDQQTEPATFTVTAGSPASGAYTTSIGAEPIASGAGSMGIGLAFSSADLGADAAHDAVGGFRQGLPPGWSWQGVGLGYGHVVVENAFDYRGFSKVVEVARDGGGTSVLGCHDTNGTWGCTELSGGRTGTGLQATLSGEDAATISMVDGDSGRTWTFATWSAPAEDDPQNQLERRDGHVMSVGAPGAAPVKITYENAKSDRISTISWDVAGPDHDLTWTILYGGDPTCSDPTPPGFVPVPAGSVCGWELPTHEWMRLFYVQAGDTAQIGRALRLPSTCAPGHYEDCQSAWDQTAITDWQWSPKQHVVAARSPQVNQAILADPSLAGQADLVTTYAYDAKGRLATSTRAADQPGGARLVSSDTFEVVGDTHQATTRLSGLGGNAVPTFESVATVDAGLRPVTSRQANGEVTRNVWLPDKNLKLATIQADGWVQASAFDGFDREVGRYDAPAVAFGPECAPGKAVSPTSCVPTSRPDRVLATTTAYDTTPGVPAGLLAEWYATPDFSGAPVAVTALATDTGSGVAVASTLPQGVTPRAVRITGGVAPASGSLKALTVEPKGGQVTGASIFVNGRFASGLGNGTPSFSVPGGKPLPASLRIDLVFDAAPNVLALIDPDAPAGSSKVLPVSALRQRWGVVAEQTTVDAETAKTFQAVTDPTSTYVATLTRTTYGDAAADGPSEVTEVACGRHGSPEEAVQACSSAPAGATTRYEYGPGPFPGQHVLLSETSPMGVKSSYQYWGQAETAQGSGLKGTDEIWSAVRDLAQRGLRRSVRSGDGHTTSTVYDLRGEARCTQVATDDDAGHWSCSETDGLGRLTRAISRSADGSHVSTVSSTYTTAPGPQPHTTTVIRNDDGTDVTVETIHAYPTGTVAAYEQRLRPGAGGAEVLTSVQSDALGRQTERTVQVTTPAGTQQVVVATAYDETTGMLDHVDVNGVQQTDVLYDSRVPWRPDEFYYPNNVTMEMYYDTPDPQDVTVGRPVGHQLVLGGGDAIDDRTRASAGGRLLLEQLDGGWQHYRYDDLGRLVAVETSYVPDPSPPPGSLSVEQLGWDDDLNLVCKVTGLPDDTGDCASQPDGPDKVVNTFANGRLTATTDTTAAPAEGAVDLAGAYTQLGEVEYRYDGFEQLASLTEGDVVTSLTRDATGRLVAVADGAGNVTAQLLYGSDSATSPVATVDAAGAVTFSVALPGGLVWHGDHGYDVLSVQGVPVAHLTPDGKRDRSVPTVRYGPFGEALPPPAAFAPAEPATAPAFDATGWQERPSLLGGVLSDLGRRTLHTGLGIFTAPDPIPGGSCTVFGYTCGDPVNQSDLTGTSVGTVILGIVVAAVVGIVLPMAFAGLMAWAGLAGATLMACYVGAAVIGSAAANVASLMVQDLASTGKVNWRSEYWEDALIGAAAGLLSGALGAASLSSTLVVGELTAETDDLEFAAKNVRSAVDADDPPFTKPTVTARYYATMGLRRVGQLYWRQKGWGFNFLDETQAQMFKNGFQRTLWQAGARAITNDGVLRTRNLIAAG